MSMDSVGQGGGDVTLTPLRPQEVAEAAAVLAASFQDAPNFVAVYPDGTKRTRALGFIFRMPLRDTVELGGVTLTVREGRIVGCAVWLPPEHTHMTFRRQLRALPLLLLPGDLQRSERAVL